MGPSRRHILSLLAAAPLLAGASARGGVGQTPPRGADELFWVPTLDQALQMAGATGRPIFLMGYSLVADGTTYTKTSDAACSGVY